MTAILVIFTIALLLTIDFSVERISRRRGAPAVAPPVPTRYRELDPTVPAGLFVAPGHTWLQIEPSGTLRLGGDALWGTLLGEIDRIELRPDGSEIVRGDWVARLVHGERSLEVRTPVDGEIEAVNPELQYEPDRLRSEPYERGWLLRMAPREIGKALRSLRLGEQANAWMRDEIGRFAELLGKLASRGAPVGVTMHDGGLPAAGLASFLDDDTFEQLAREMLQTRAADFQEER